MPVSAKKKLEIAERDRRVIELKTRGLTFAQIAASGVPGVSHAQQAKVCFDRGMKQIVQVAAEDYRALENEKLDLLERQLTKIITDTGYEVSHKLKAAATMVTVLKRRADLNGLDAQPTDGGTTITTVFASSDVLGKTITQ
jgi:hypothetical protein